VLDKAWQVEAVLWSVGSTEEQAGEEAEQRVETDSDAEEEEENEEGVEADGPEIA